MESRSFLNRHPAIVIVGTCLLVALAAYVIFRQVKPVVRIPDTLFYTNDDGATFFRDSINLTPPFMKDGKEAVVARVFMIGSQQKVGYMERYTPEAKAIIERFKASTKKGPTTAAAGPPANVGALIGAQQMGRQFKKPGDTKWVTARDTLAVTEVCKVYDGTAPATAVDP